MPDKKPRTTTLQDLWNYAQLERVRIYGLLPKPKPPPKESIPSETTSELPGAFKVSGFISDFINNKKYKEYEVQSPVSLLASGDQTTLNNMSKGLDWILNAPPGLPTLAKRAGWDLTMPFPQLWAEEQYAKDQEKLFKEFVPKPTTTKFVDKSGNDIQPVIGNMPDIFTTIGNIFGTRNTKQELLDKLREGKDIYSDDWMNNIIFQPFLSGLIPGYSSLRQRGIESEQEDFGIITKRWKNKSFFDLAGLSDISDIAEGPINPLMFMPTPVGTMSDVLKPFTGRPLESHSYIDRLKNPEDIVMQYKMLEDLKKQGKLMDSDINLIVSGLSNFAGLAAWFALARKGTNAVIPASTAKLLRTPTILERGIKALRNFGRAGTEMGLANLPNNIVDVIVNSDRNNYGVTNELVKRFTHDVAIGGLFSVGQGVGNKVAKVLTNTVGPWLANSPVARTLIGYTAIAGEQEVTRGFIPMALGTGTSGALGYAQGYLLSSSKDERERRKEAWQSAMSLIGMHIVTLLQQGWGTYQGAKEIKTYKEQINNRQKINDLIYDTPVKEVLEKVDEKIKKEPIDEVDKGADEHAQKLVDKLKSTGTILQEKDRVNNQHNINVLRTNAESIQAALLRQETKLKTLQKGTPVYEKAKEEYDKINKYLNKSVMELEQAIDSHKLIFGEEYTGIDYSVYDSSDPLQKKKDVVVNKSSPVKQVKKTVDEKKNVEKRDWLSIVREYFTDDKLPLQQELDQHRFRKEKVQKIKTHLNESMGKLPEKAIDNIKANLSEAETVVEAIREKIIKYHGVDPESPTASVDKPIAKIAKRGRPKGSKNKASSRELTPEEKKEVSQKQGTQKVLDAITEVYTNIEEQKLANNPPSVEKLEEKTRNNQSDIFSIPDNDSWEVFEITSPSGAKYKLPFKEYRDYFGHFKDLDNPDNRIGDDASIGFQPGVLMQDPSKHTTARMEIMRGLENQGLPQQEIDRFFREYKNFFINMEKKYQAESDVGKHPIVKRLDQAILQIASDLNIPVQTFKSIKDAHGNDVVAFANVIDNFIGVLEDPSGNYWRLGDKFTLAEEVMHLITEAGGGFGGNRWLRILKRDIHKWEGYDAIADRYESIYDNPEKIREEATVKFLTEALVDKWHLTKDPSWIQKGKNILNMILNWVRKTFNPNSAQTFKDTNKILTDMVTETILNREGRLHIEFEYSDRTEIQRFLYKRPPQNDFKLVGGIKERLSGEDNEVPREIFESLAINSQNYAVAGSLALGTQGKIFRKSPYDVHDLDLAIKAGTFTALEQVFENIGWVNNKVGTFKNGDIVFKEGPFRNVDTRDGDQVITGSYIFTKIPDDWDGISPIPEKNKVNVDFFENSKAEWATHTFAEGYRISPYDKAFWAKLGYFNASQIKKSRMDIQNFGVDPKSRMDEKGEFVHRLTDDRGIWYDVNKTDEVLSQNRLDYIKSEIRKFSSGGYTTSSARIEATITKYDEILKDPNLTIGDKDRITDLVKTLREELGRRDSEINTLDINKTNRKIENLVSEEEINKINVEIRRDKNEEMVKLYDEILGRVQLGDGKDLERSMSYLNIKDYLPFQAGYNRGNAMSLIESIRRSVDFNGEDVARENFIKAHINVLPKEVQEKASASLQKLYSAIFNRYLQSQPMKSVALLWASRGGLDGRPFINKVVIVPTEAGKIIKGDTPSYNVVNLNSKVVGNLQSVFGDMYQEVYINKNTISSLTKDSKNPNENIAKTENANVHKLVAHGSGTPIDVFSQGLEGGILLIPKGESKEFIAVEVSGIKEMGVVGTDGKIRFVNLPNARYGTYSRSNGTDKNGRVTSVDPNLYKMIESYDELFGGSEHNVLDSPISKPVDLTFIEEGNTNIRTAKTYRDVLTALLHSPDTIPNELIEKGKEVVKSNLETLTRAGEDLDKLGSILDTVVKKALWQLHTAYYVNAFRGDTSPREKFIQNTKYLIEGKIQGEKTGFANFLKRLKEVKTDTPSSFDKAWYDATIRKYNGNPGTGAIPDVSIFNMIDNKPHITAIIGHSLVDNADALRAKYKDNPEATALLESLFEEIAFDRGGGVLGAVLDGAMLGTVFSRSGTESGKISAMGLLAEMFGGNHQDMLKHSISLPGFMVKSGGYSNEQGSYLNERLAEKNIGLYLPMEVVKILRTEYNKGIDDVITTSPGELGFGKKKPWKIWDNVEEITDDHVIDIPLDIFRKLLNKNEVHETTSAFTNVTPSGERINKLLQNLDSNRFIELAEETIRQNIGYNTVVMSNMIEKFKRSPKEYINYLLRRVKDPVDKLQLLEMAQYPASAKLPEFLIRITNDFIKKEIIENVVSGHTKGAFPIDVPHNRTKVIKSIYRMVLKDKFKGEFERESEIDKRWQNIFQVEEKVEEGKGDKTTSTLDEFDIMAQEIAKQALTPITMENGVWKGGHLKPGYVIIGNGIADKHTVLSSDINSKFNRAFTSIVPTTVLLDAHPVRIIGVMSERIDSPNGVMTSPLLDIGILGRDRDGDAKSISFARNDEDIMFHSLWEEYDKHVKKMVEFYNEHTKEGTPKTPQQIQDFANKLSSIYEWTPDSRKINWKDTWSTSNMDMSIERFTQKTVGQVVTLSKRLNDLLRGNFNIEIPIYDEANRQVGKFKYNGNKELIETHNNISYVLKVLSTDLAKGMIPVERLETKKALANLMRNTDTNGKSLSNSVLDPQRKLADELFIGIINKYFDKGLEITGKHYYDESKVLDYLSIMKDSDEIIKTVNILESRNTPVLDKLYRDMQSSLLKKMNNEFLNKLPFGDYYKQARESFSYDSQKSMILNAIKGINSVAKIDTPFEQAEEVRLKLYSDILNKYPDILQDKVLQYAIKAGYGSSSIWYDYRKYANNPELIANLDKIYKYNILKYFPETLKQDVNLFISMLDNKPGLTPTLAKSNDVLSMTSRKNIMSYIQESSSIVNASGDAVVILPDNVKTSFLRVPSKLLLPGVSAKTEHPINDYRVINFGGIKSELKGTNEPMVFVVRYKDTNKQELSQPMVLVAGYLKDVLSSDTRKGNLINNFFIGNDRLRYLENVTWSMMTEDSKRQDLNKLVSTGLNGISYSEGKKKKIALLAMLNPSAFWDIIGTDNKMVELKKQNLNEYQVNTSLGPELVKQHDPELYKAWYKKLSDNLSTRFGVGEKTEVEEMVAKAKEKDEDKLSKVIGGGLGAFVPFSAAVDIGTVATVAGIATVGIAVMKGAYRLASAIKSAIKMRGQTGNMRLRQFKEVKELLEINDPVKQLEHIEGMFRMQSQLLKETLGSETDALEYFKGLLGGGTIQELKEKAMSGDRDARMRLQGVAFAMADFLGSFRNSYGKSLGGIFNAVTWKYQAPLYMVHYFGKKNIARNASDLLILSRLINPDTGGIYMDKDGKADGLKLTYGHFNSLYTGKPTAEDSIVYSSLAEHTAAMSFIMTNTLDSYQNFGKALLNYLDILYPGSQHNVVPNILATSNIIKDKIRFEGGRVMLKSEYDAIKGLTGEKGKIAKDRISHNMLPWEIGSQAPLIAKTKTLETPPSTKNNAEFYTKIVDKMIDWNNQTLVEKLCNEYGIPYDDIATARTILKSNLGNAISKEFFMDYYMKTFLRQTWMLQHDISESMKSTGHWGAVTLWDEYAGKFAKSISNHTYVMDHKSMFPLMFDSDTKRNQYIKENIKNIVKGIVSTQNYEEIRDLFITFTDGDMWGNYLKDGVIVRDGEFGEYEVDSNRLKHIMLYQIFEKASAPNTSDDEIYNKVIDFQNSTDKDAIVEVVADAYVENMKSSEAIYLDVLGGRRGYSTLPIFGINAVFAHMKDATKFKDGSYGILKDPDVYYKYIQKVSKSIVSRFTGLMAEWFNTSAIQSGENNIAKEMMLHILKEVGGYKRAFYDETTARKLKPGDVIYYLSPKEDLNQYQPGIVTKVEKDRVFINPTSRFIDPSQRDAVWIDDPNTIYKASSHDYWMDLSYKIGQMASKGDLSKQLKISDAVHSVPKAIFGLFNKIDVTSSLGGPKLVKYLKNNVANFDAWRLGGKKDFARYFGKVFRILGFHSEKMLTQAQKDIQQKGNLAIDNTLLEIATDLTNFEHTTGYYMGRLFKGADETLGEQGGIEGKAMAFKQLLKKLGSYWMGGEWSPKTEKKQREMWGTLWAAQTHGVFETVSKEGKNLQLVQKEVDETLNMLTYYMANFHLTGDYTAFGRPQAATTTAGRWLNLFLTWKSNKISSFQIMRNAVYEEKLAQMFGQFKKDGFINYLHKDGTVTKHHSWSDTWRRSIWAYSTRAAAGAFASLVKKGLVYYLLCKMFGEDEEDPSGIANTAQKIAFDMWTANVEGFGTPQILGIWNKLSGDPIVESVIPMMNATDDIISTMIGKKKLYELEYVNSEAFGPYNRLTSDATKGLLDIIRVFSAGLASGELANFFVYMGLSSLISENDGASSARAEGWRNFTPFGSAFNIMEGRPWDEVLLGGTGLINYIPLKRQEGIGSPFGYESPQRVIQNMFNFINASPSTINESVSEQKKEKKQEENKAKRTPKQQEKYNKSKATREKNKEKKKQELIDKSGGYK